MIDLVFGVARDGVVWVALLVGGQSSGRGWSFGSWAEALQFCARWRLLDRCERWQVTSEEREAQRRAGVTVLH